MSINTIVRSKKLFVRGQSLVEIVVIVGVVVLLVTGLIVASTSTLRSGQQSKSRSQATNLAREALEHARAERDTDWVQFSARSGAYCFSESYSWSQEIECPMTIQNQFSRTVTFDGTATGVNVTVIVEWWESLVKRNVTLQTTFTDWKTS